MQMFGEGDIDDIQGRAQSDSKKGSGTFIGGSKSVGMQLFDQTYT
jgi:hypothetical protein